MSGEINKIDKKDAADHPQKSESSSKEPSNSYGGVQYNNCTVNMYSGSLPSAPMYWSPPPVYPPYHGYAPEYYPYPCEPYEQHN